ncbi:MAG: hypothetical protein ACRD92_08525 [Nitrosopumilaceae archaeon]
MRKNYLTVGSAMIVIGIILFVIVVFYSQKEIEGLRTLQDYDTETLLVLNYVGLVGTSGAIIGIPVLVAGLVTKFKPIMILIAAPLLFIIWILFIFSRGS